MVVATGSNRGAALASFSLRTQLKRDSVIASASRRQAFLCIRHGKLSAPSQFPGQLLSVNVNEDTRSGKTIDTVM